MRWRLKFQDVSTECLMLQCCAVCGVVRYVVLCMLWAVVYYVCYVVLFMLWDVLWAVLCSVCYAV